MKQATLDAIAPLLEALRAHPALSEARPAEFQVDGRDFLHFHEDEAGVVADVRLAEGRVSMPVGEVSVIERCHLLLAVMLCEGDDARVDLVEREIDVVAAELRDAAMIGNFVAAFPGESPETRHTRRRLRRQRPASPRPSSRGQPTGRPRGHRRSGW